MFMGAKGVVRKPAHSVIGDCAEIRTVLAIVFRLDSMFRQFVIEGLAWQLQQFCRCAGVPLVRLKRVDDQSAFDLRELLSQAKVFSI